MSVLRFRPHVLSYKELKQGTFDDETGDYNHVKTDWVNNYCKCDAVPNGKADVLTKTDGTKISYSYTVFLPFDCRTFKYGEKVRISFEDGHLEEFSVKGFNRFQLLSKLYV